MEIPYGYCHCGCGEKTPIASMTRRSCGHIKGEPIRFIHTHHSRVPVADRFWSKVARASADECWPWLSSTGQFGYGQIMIGSYGHAGKARPFAAHRIAWELTHGRIPDGLYVLHRCDNPPCVNPNHLFLGTQGDNIRDAQAKNRIRGTYVAGHTPHQRLTAEQVIEARRCVAEGETVASLARLYNVSYSTISHAIHRRTWRHLP